MRLSEVKEGKTATVIKILGHGGFRKHMTEQGISIGQKALTLNNDPLEELLKFSINTGEIALRRSEAQMILVEVLGEEKGKDEDTAENQRNHINIAIIGTPLSRKTELFNIATSSFVPLDREKEKEFSSHSGLLTRYGYDFHFTLLPGISAMSSYTAEEKFVRNYISNNTPDIVLNIVHAPSMENSLYLTTELLDMSQRMVVVLTDFDVLQRHAKHLDYDMLARMIGVPIIPTGSDISTSVDEILRTILSVYENRDDRVRHIHISEGILEESVSRLNSILKNHRDELPKAYPPRYYAKRLLQDDEQVIEELRGRPHFNEWMDIQRKEKEHIMGDLSEDEDIESVFLDQKYGFVLGALRETLQQRKKEDPHRASYILDRLLTHHIWGYPIFFFFVWLMFYSTFTLGAYPQQWIENGVEALRHLFQMNMIDGELKSLLVNGVIGGVGGVIIFLPNIMILYLFIAFFEDSGYLSRAAVLMDGVMHRLGLHGKSFIPLIMGFGCNVPAILATNSIESRSSRLLTALITPFMSCSARLPIYILLIGAFFPDWATWMMTLIYFIGILVAILSARLLHRIIFSSKEAPYVMELPPYRIPTLKATMSHMWERCSQYLRKMGGLILVASVMVWALSYYPNTNAELQNTQEHYEQSYIGRIGKFCAPVLEPMDLGWKASVSLISGIAAKEIMVSTLSVLYPAEEHNESTEEDELTEESHMLKDRILESRDYSTASALALMIFTLLYFPCLASLGAIATEHGWRWACFSAIYNTAIAWIVSFIVYSIVSLF
ncbi:MAG: ferrous iron transport protein B [Alistipes sp.]|nr:ferrous iron transport protein B [Candidatus Alistipes equi]